MERKEELQEISKKLDPEMKKLIDPLIEKMIFLEEKLNYLMSLPFLIVKEGDATKQRVTPAYKQYKDLMQTYINTLKVVYSALGVEEGNEKESPLRKYLTQRLNRKKEDA